MTPRSLSPDLRLKVVCASCSWPMTVPRSCPLSPCDNRAQNLLPGACSSRVHHRGVGRDSHQVTGPDPKHCPCPLNPPNPVPPASLPHPSSLSLQPALALVSSSSTWTTVLASSSPSREASPSFSNLSARGPCPHHHSPMREF